MLLHNSPYRKPLLILLTLVLLMSAGIFILNLSDNEIPDDANGTSDVPRQTTLAGQFTCLPHKDTGGPTTLECAFGLQADDGNHYALDMSAVSTDPSVVWSMEGRVTVEGLFVPITAVSTDQWAKYDIAGIVQVSAVNEE